jgi:thioredoxin-related protein
MKIVLLLGLCLVFTGIPEWTTDFSHAKELAAKESKLILLNFSGSDWCAPCIRLKKEVFSSAKFNETADSNLVLVNADFPRSRKNKQDKQLQLQNEALAEKYNPQGKFPFTLLLRANGSVIQSWDGFPRGGAESFTNELQQLCKANLPQ